MIHLSVFVLLFCGALGALEPIELTRMRLNPLFPQGRIVGGYDVDITQLPYQVALEYGGSHFCGGTLIGSRNVLTAAHCIIAPADKITVRLGSTRRMEGGKVIKLLKHYTHPRYNKYNFDFDVAILDLASEVQVTSSTKPAPVQDTEPSTGEYFRVSGWGMTREDGQCSPTLKAVDVPIVSRRTCQSMYSQYQISITERMICAYAPGKDSCQGDSGGPAVVNGRVAGIVSWGVGCARPNFPGVYTNVAQSDVRHFISQYAGV